MNNRPYSICTERKPVVQSGVLTGPVKTRCDLVDHVPVNFASIWAVASDIKAVPRTISDSKDGDIFACEGAKFNEPIVDICLGKLKGGLRGPARVLADLYTNCRNVFWLEALDFDPY